MSIKSNRIRSRLAVTGVAAAAALAIGAGTPAAANEMHGGMGMHGGGMGMREGGMEMHEGGGWHKGHGRHMFKPHNAASDFMIFAHELNFNQNQMQQLMQLRDQWIQNNAVAEAQLHAYKSDLKWLLISNVAADNFDQQAIDNKLKQIDQDRTQLWKNYVDQLKSINQLMTSQQKNQLMTMMTEYAHGGEFHGKMHGGMGNGNMNGNMNRNPSSTTGTMNNNTGSGGMNMNQGGSNQNNGSDSNQENGNGMNQDNGGENGQSGG